MGVSRHHFLQAVILLILCGAGSLLEAQEASPPLSADNSVPASSTETSRAGDIKKLGSGIWSDQKRIWTSPLRFRRSDMNWLFPVAGVTAGLIAADRGIQEHVGSSRVTTSQHLSDAAVLAELGSAGAFYTLGRVQQNPHVKETGLLGYQAALNSLILNSAVQGISRRARPGSGSQTGNFFVGGSSFPSDHAAVAWSIASVFAHEYPGWGTKLFAYGAATTVSLTRVSGQKHFTSDVFVGSTLGWLIGRETYRVHHSRHLPGQDIGNFRSKIEKISNPMHQGTTYVPVDSWVYPAYDRLAALGYAPIGSQNLKPWTRLEFARLLQEASLMDPSSSDEVNILYKDLQEEFAIDQRILDGDRNVDATLDSVYTRFTTISGTPLTDGFHLGKTIVDDYGRPYQRGFNTVLGMATHAEAGPFAFFVRGEYQHAPLAPALPDSVRVATASADGLPVAPATPFSEVNRFRVLEAYVALNLSGWQFSFGKQALWWGPAQGQELMFSNNAEPVTMLRLSRVTPWKVPVIGNVHSDTFLAQLDGYHFLRLGATFELTGSYEHHIDPQPYMWGYKLGVQPTRNLQLGISLTTVFAGLGRPLTFDTFFHTFSWSGNAQAVEPGDRRAGFDFSYRIPGLRKWLILYSASVVEDEYSPIAFPRRSAWNPGIYLPRIPKLPKLDLHIESAYTNLPNDPRFAVFYTNAHYAGGYTNNGQIMGGWVGPEGQAYQTWANYWLAGQSKIQFGFRMQTVDRAYVSGGRLQDYYGSYDFLLRTGIRVNAGIKYERWKFPVLANTPQSNFTTSVQFTYQPKHLSLRRQ